MITIYTKNNCHYCTMAKSLLDKYDVNFREVNIDDDLDAKDFIVRLGFRTMPQIFAANGKVIDGGYTGLSKLSKEEILAMGNQ